jgi:hypothetical protein
MVQGAREPLGRAARWSGTLRASPNVQIQINRSLSVASVFSSEATEPAHDGVIFRQAGPPQNAHSSLRRQDVEQRQKEPSQPFALHGINDGKRELGDCGLVWHSDKSGYPKARSGRRLGGNRHPSDVIDLVHFGEIAQLGF